MTLECRMCKKRWDVEGYSKEGTFYTLCADCGAKVLRDLRKMDREGFFAKVVSEIVREGK